jgi:hypothetical protein
VRRPHALLELLEQLGKCASLVLISSRKLCQLVPLLLAQHFLGVCAALTFLISWPALGEPRHLTLVGLALALDCLALKRRSSFVGGKEALVYLLLELGGNIVQLAIEVVKHLHGVGQRRAVKRLADEVPLKKLGKTIKLVN